VRLFALGASLLMTACGAAADTPLPLGPPRVAGALQPIAVTATPVPLNARDPAQVRVGQLVYAGGVALSAPGASRLAGLSDLTLGRDGRLKAVTDHGDLFQARLVLDARGRLTGLAGATLSALRDETGRIAASKSDADAEGITELRDGRLAIAFEGRPRVLAYANPLRAPKPLPAPGPEARLPPNAGLEAISSLDDGFLVGAEGGQVWRCQAPEGCRNAGVFGDRLKPPYGFRLTGLREHGLTTFALHRAYDPFQGMRTEILAVEFDGHLHWHRAVLGRLERPLVTGNFEGIAVDPRRTPTRLYLVSDNGFPHGSPTLLLAFDWVPES